MTKRKNYPKEFSIVLQASPVDIAIKYTVYSRDQEKVEEIEGTNPQMLEIFESLVQRYYGEIDKLILFGERAYTKHLYTVLTEGYKNDYKKETGIKKFIYC